MKTILLSAIILISACCNCIAEKDRLDKIIETLMFIESSNRPHAVSRNGKDVGILQITKPMVDEVNRIMRRKIYTLDDRYDVQKSVDMARIFYTYWMPRWGNLSDRELFGRWNRPDGSAPEWYKDRCIKHLNKIGG